MNHATTEVFLDGVARGELVGEEGKGFRHILDGLNAERILIAAECVGDGRWFVEKASRYATERVVFGRPIGANQGVQFPIARAHAARRGRRPDALQGRLAVRPRRAVRRRGEHGEAARLRGVVGGGERLPRRPRRLRASRAEYDVERKFRETRLYPVAPVSNNLVLAYLGQHVLGMPRSY